MTADKAGPDHATGRGADERAAEPRPLIERLGLAVIALVVTAMFGAITLAALSGGELFLGVMAGTGALMTVWAAASTLRRG
jgi:hypothetical protein